MRCALAWASEEQAHTAVIAANCTATHSPTQLLKQFQAAGFTTTDSPQLTQTRRDHIAVFTALRMDATATRAEQTATFAKIGAHLIGARLLVS